MKWFAKAPSNIALIKYMGKSDPEQNIPANSSISYTLPELVSYVEIESIHGDADIWEPLEIPGGVIFDLSDLGRTRFLEHLTWIKQQFEYTGSFAVRSCNNFPMASGLASSASSFAALTIAACRALSELCEQDEPSQEQMAIMSRNGSGSSCRSFFEPWALWTPEHVGSIELPYKKLISHVILISKEEKQVSSSSAHARIQSSPLFADRPQRANTNLENLIQALNDENWRRIYEIVWDEFIDMHQLFESSKPAFTYRNEQTEWALNELQAYWEQHGDGPVITMDAGPNIHLLFREDQATMAKQIRFEFLRNFDVL